jgi:conjugal transfer pilin signal peptidase TrbI
MNTEVLASSRRGLSRLQWLLVFVICAALAMLAHRYVRIGFNETGSLKAKLFLIVRGTVPSDRGDYVVFRWAGQGGFYRTGMLFTKIIQGLPGESVEVGPNGLVKVSGRVIGYAKPRASNGVKLEPIEPGPIPPGYFFVAGQSDNSLDSRYKLVGLIKQELVVGTAYAIF